MFRLLKTPIKVTCALTGLYGAGVWWSLKNPDGTTYKIFEHYVPLGRDVLDHFEEKTHMANLMSRQQFYEKQQSVKPYISKTYSHDNVIGANLNGTGGYASEVDEELELDDPLPPQQFFDAQSGTVGTSSRQYLPLVVLPNINDPVIHDVSMALNDLISSVNAAAVSDETVRAVAKRFRRLAESTSQKYPDDKTSIKMFRHESVVFDSLVNAYQALRTEYGVPNVPPDQTRKYLKRISREILKVEPVLVSHCNKHNSNGNNSRNMWTAASTEEQRRQGSGSNLSASNSTAASHLNPQRDNHGMFLPPGTAVSPEILDLQLSFTLLADALHMGSGIPIDHYIRSIRNTVEASREEDKRKLVNQALERANIPADVDMDAIVGRILTGTK